MSRYRYVLDLTPDDNDTFLVTCPDLPEVTSFGETEEDARRHGELAVEEAIAARLARFEEIPEPAVPPAGSRSVFASLPLRLQPKVALINAMRRRRLSRADLVRMTGWSRNSVDRLFDPQHNNRLEQFEQAFAALDITPAFVAEPAEEFRRR